MQTLKFLFAMGALAAVILPFQGQAAPDNAEQAKMREALRQMMESNPPRNAPAAAVTPAPVPVPARAPVAPAPAPAQARPVFGPVPPPSQPGVASVMTQVMTMAPTFGPVPPPDDGANLVSAGEIMRQKLQASPAPATPLTPALPVYTAIQVPASPLSAAKQAKLDDLLVRYRADTITAQDYHKQRAAILAGP